MKLFSLFILGLTISFSGTANTEKKKVEDKTFAEKRHVKAREILKNNFEAFEQREEKKNEKPDFGFIKEEKENDQNL